MKMPYSPEIEYNSKKNVVRIELRPPKPESTIKREPFELGQDEEGEICQLAITSSTEVLEEFKKSLKSVRLGGIWKGIEITEEDIREVREDLLKKLEEKW
jgi:hypothetical protein